MKDGQQPLPVDGSLHRLLCLLLPEPPRCLYLSSLSKVSRRALPWLATLLVQSTVVVVPGMLWCAAGVSHCNTDLHDCQRYRTQNIATGCLQAARGSQFLAPALSCIPHGPYIPRFCFCVGTSCWHMQQCSISKLLVRGKQTWQTQH